MPIPTDAPPAARSLREELDDVTLDETDDLAGAVPAPTPEGEPPPPDAEAPADAEPTDEADQLLEPEPDSGTEPPPAPPVTWQPPPGGEPFSFRVDGREVTVPGAQRWDHGIYVPAEAWGVIQRHVADREVLGAQRRLLEQQVAARDPARHPDVLRAQATLQAVQQLLDQGPEAVAQWLDQYQQTRPLLEAQIQNQTLQAQLQATTQGVQQQQSEAVAAQLAQQLPGYLQQNIDATISQDPALAPLAGLGSQLLDRLWPYAEWLFLEADRDYPEYGLQRGQIIVRPDRLKHLLGQQATTQRELKRLEQAAAHNRAATSPVAAAPTVPSRGRPAVAGRQPAPPLSADDWRDSYLSGGDEE